jgi:hypothetical protein
MDGAMESRESSRAKSESPAQAGKLPPMAVPPVRSAPAQTETLPPSEPAPAASSPAESFMGLIGAVEERFSPEKAVAEQLLALDGWVRRNERDRRLVALRFWLLKLPAFVGAVGATVAEAYGYGRSVILLGAIAALAIAIDSALSGPAQTPYQRAIQDIRNLQNSVKLKWDKVRILHPDPSEPARTDAALAILDAIQVRRNEIAKYFASPQTSPTSETGL